MVILSFVVNFYIWLFHPNTSVKYMQTGCIIHVITLLTIYMSCLCLLVIQGVINPENEKWRDVNVLSSLLKDFLRKLPDPLIPSASYKSFIETNRIQDAKVRLLSLKHILSTLPDANYETLKYLCSHLRRVSEYGHINKVGYGMYSQCAVKSIC